MSREVPANALEFGVDSPEFGLEPFPVGVALFEVLQFLPRLFAELDDVGCACAVLALKRLDEVEPVFEQLLAGWIGVQLLGIVRKIALEVAEKRERLFVQREQADGVGVEPFQLQQSAAQHPRLGRERIFVFTQLPQGALREFEQPGGVAGQPVFPFECRFLVGGKFGGRDFAGLMTKQVELLRVSPFVHDQ